MIATEVQPVVFIIDDDASVRDGVGDLLRSVGLGVQSFGSTQEFLQSKRPNAPGCIVLDVRLPGASGLEFQRTLAESSILLPVIFVTGHGDISMSVRAIKSGALEFLTKPLPGQQFLDVVEGQVKFLERVVELHPEAPRPFAIGNCQAGYQVLMAAMLRPDLFGPCLVAGAPMSYWQGVHGKNPVRYAGGLLGGSWLTALTSDLGNGKFDGTWLVLNFDKLNPANWLWGKQYDVYANVDTEAERYLGFEKWWGDFIQLGGDEMQFLVDQLFIGDKLTRNELRSSDGTTFDLRNVTSPIIVFTSMGDNISPPRQSLGWILDLYRDVDDIRATGRTIVYGLNEKVGHLAIFVSSKVAAKEDEEMIRLMDLIDCLPPGLYEMVISPRDATVAVAPGAWITRFEARTLDDLRALGRNSEADDRAFATVARMSEIMHSIYCTFWQPAIRAMVTEPAADLPRTLLPNQAAGRKS
jgi:ActR/RegA family two-component response regulator